MALRDSQCNVANVLSDVPEVSGLRVIRQRKTAACPATMDGSSRIRCDQGPGPGFGLREHPPLASVGRFDIKTVIVSYFGIATLARPDRGFVLDIDLEQEDNKLQKGSIHVQKEQKLQKEENYTLFQPPRRPEIFPRCRTRLTTVCSATLDAFP